MIPVVSCVRPRGTVHVYMTEPLWPSEPVAVCVCVEGCGTSTYFIFALGWRKLSVLLGFLCAHCLERHGRGASLASRCE